MLGNGGFYGSLSEPQGISAWWKETAETGTVYIFLSCSLLLSHLKPQSSKS